MGYIWAYFLPNINLFLIGVIKIREHVDVQHVRVDGEHPTTPIKGREILRLISLNISVGYHFVVTSPKSLIRFLFA